MAKDRSMAKALWYVGDGRAELRQEAVGPPGAGELRVRALYGAISRGTERLVASGRVPASEYERMRAPLMAGSFPFPVKYGYATPDEAPRDCDLVFHTSASPKGLATALALAGDEATIVELSWYGTGEVAVPLGEAFHSRRLRLVASQVGQVAPSHRSRWTYG